ncbi:MAG: RidA family protein [Bacteroidales bacterium]|nr:RidA family protein [Bacteroidales bacterium]
MKAIVTPSAPKPIGPYSQAVLVDKTLYISGQIPINPESGNIIDESYALATKQVMDNIVAILQEAEMQIENVVKCSIFLKDMNEFPTVNAVYANYFQTNSIFPARETIEVSKLPKDALVEISAIAVAK